jgi:hypothetical protein
VSGSRFTGPLADLEYLVVRQDLRTGDLTVVGDTGYPARARTAAEEAARDAAAAAKDQGQSAVHAVVRIADPDFVDQLPESWLWVSETSYGGTSWSNESMGGASFAGLEDGPEQAEAAAAFFLRRRLAQLAPDADDIEMDDDWWRVSVWHAVRLDETDHPAAGGRIADRAELLATPEKLAWLGSILRTDHVHADAVATATPRQVSRILSEAFSSRS